MSFASILSGPAEERSPPKRQSPPPETTPAPVTSTPREATQLSPPPPPHVPPSHQKVKEQEQVLPRLEKKPSSEKRRRNAEQDNKAGEPSNGILSNGIPEPTKTTTQSWSFLSPRKVLSERESETINKLMVEIDNAEKSDVEAPGFEEEYEQYKLQCKRRALHTLKEEGIKRKVSRCI